MVNFFHSQMYFKDFLQSFSQLKRLFTLSTWNAQPSLKSSFSILISKGKLTPENPACWFSYTKNVRFLFFAHKERDLFDWFTKNSWDIKVKDTFCIYDFFILILYKQEIDD